MKIFGLLISLRKFVLYKILKLTTFGVRVLLKRGNEILLIKHPYDDFWVFPGGGIKKGEDEMVAAKREIKEETGYIVSSIKIFGRYKNTSGDKNDYVTLFFSDDFKGSNDRKNIIDQIEIQKQGWFNIDNLPPTSPATKRRIEELKILDFRDSVRRW